MRSGSIISLTREAYRAAEHLSGVTPGFAVRLHGMTQHSHYRGRRSRFQRGAQIIATAATFSFIAGCGSDGPLAPGLGSGNLAASGAVSASGSGVALFQSASSGGLTVFQIVLAPISQSANTWELQIATSAGRPATGTYDLKPLSASSADPTATFVYINGGNIQTFNSTSGQLTITSSSPTTVRGTFAFTATDPSGGTATITAIGSFNAPCAPGMSCQ